MFLAGGMLLRNEAWVAGLSLRVARSWCDAVVVGLHDCVDASEEIVDSVNEEMGGIVKLHFRGPWDEMNHRQELLLAARKLHASHFAIVDADEILTGNLLPEVRGYVKHTDPRLVLNLPGYNLRGGLCQYHANGIWGNRWFSVAFKDNPALGWQGDRFHHREPMGITMGASKVAGQGAGGIMHLWGASERRLLAKHALYKLTEAIRWPAKSHADIDQMYSMAIRPQAAPQFAQTWEYAPVPKEWWAPYTPWAKYINVDAVPWQESECQKLLDTHGRASFAGLDLFGVV